MTGYGQDGPYKDMVGHDINYLSFGGVLGLTGEPGRKPAIPAIQVADMAAGGMYAAMGIMAALFARQSTGKGQYIDISMLDGIVAMLPFPASLLWGSGKIPQRGTPFSAVGSPATASTRPGTENIFPSGGPGTAFLGGAL